MTRPIDAGEEKRPGSPTYSLTAPPRSSADDPAQRRLTVAAFALLLLLAVASAIALLTLFAACDPEESQSLSAARPAMLEATPVPVRPLESMHG